MSYTLRNNLSCCRVDGHLIFLDLLEDRYFRLPDRLENTFIVYLDSAKPTEVDVEELVKRNILTNAPAAEHHTLIPTINPPSYSAAEQRPVIRTLDICSLREVFAIVCSTQMQLKRRRLNTIIDKLVAYREDNASCANSGLSEPPEQCLLDAVRMFRRARLYVPIPTRCLLDSLSLIKFLARRRMHANLVFGVTRIPFAAHCWVQTADWVLNDAVGDVITFTPIRVA